MSGARLTPFPRTFLFIYQGSGLLLSPVQRPTLYWIWLKVSQVWSWVDLSQPPISSRSACLPKMLRTDRTGHHMCISTFFSRRAEEREGENWVKAFFSWEGTQKVGFFVSLTLFPFYNPWQEKLSNFYKRKNGGGEKLKKCPVCYLLLLSWLPCQLRKIDGNCSECLALSQLTPLYLPFTQLLFFFQVWCTLRPQS